MSGVSSMVWCVECVVMDGMDGMDGMDTMDGVCMPVSACVWI